MLGVDTTDATGGVTIPGTIGGSLGLTKLGPNALTRHRQQHLQRPDVVSAGSLTVNGSLPSAGSVTVNAGGHAQRHRQGGQRDRQYLGALFPGLAGVGTLTTTSVTLGNSSILEESIGSLSGQNTMLAVSGSG